LKPSALLIENLDSFLFENKNMNIELNIDELVLNGFAYGDRYLISEAIQQELGRLLAEEGLPSVASQSGDVSRLDGGTFDMTPNSKPTSIGKQVARTVYKGMNR
jgi:hypothetical protein